jgi:hypothetical protein
MKRHFVFLVFAVSLFFIFLFRSSLAGVTMGSERLQRHIEKVQPVEQQKKGLTVHEKAIIEQMEKSAHTPAPSPEPVPEITQAVEPEPEPLTPKKPWLLLILFYLFVGVVGVGGVTLLVNQVKMRMDERTERDF